ncbi:protein NO VEIN domain-containing protein [Promicromonospora sp. NPDC059942]|uniref:protein NO VEIN domain-containing protein n=1 Tax=Promicromonospora sp. NPDC059942 TaxID=3347009 RepID=UPI0036680052
MAEVFLHNVAFSRAEDAREYVSRLPELALNEWYWNLWKIRQQPHTTFYDGALVGLVVSWPGHGSVAFLARARRVLAEGFSGWRAATKAIADHTGLPLREVRSETYLASKRDGDGGQVLAWQADILRPLHLDLPAEVSLGRNGWAVIDDADLVGWALDGEEVSQRTSRNSAGFILDAEAKRAIELRAVDVVIAWCGQNGWHEVRHVGDEDNPFDIEGTVGGTLRRVEVKGTTGGAGTVTVTRREVEAATGDMNHLMAIVHGISLHVDGGDGTIKAKGGVLTVHDPWLPVLEELTPINYRWQR